MSIREHPTPWVMDRFAGDDSTTVVTDANGHVIAGPIDYRRYESCTVVEGMDEEVATLMAASPKLLDACQAALRYMTMDGPDGADDVRATLKDAIAATKVKP